MPATPLGQRIKTVENTMWSAPLTVDRSQAPAGPPRELHLGPRSALDPNSALRDVTSTSGLPPANRTFALIALKSQPVGVCGYDRIPILLATAPIPNARSRN